MPAPMFHIFRNSPMGRENLLQTMDFCRQFGGLSLTVYVPVTTQGLMYFDSGVVTIDLDSSYTAHADTALEHLEQILADAPFKWSRLPSPEFTASTLPNIPVGWSLMACPRVISDQSSRIGLGHIGPKVRAIVRHASFPVFIPCACYKPWARVAAFFGGSELGLQAVRVARLIAQRAKTPLTVFSQGDELDREACLAMLEKEGITEDESGASGRWVVFERRSLEENLFAIAFDSLMVLGAAGHRLMHELLFGSKLELIQSTLPNPMVVVGPHCDLKRLV